MTISIITITRNNAAGLRRTLQSLKEQTFHDVEHIIVDGESTDDTLAVLDTLRGRSKVMSHSPLGVYDAINAGFRLVTGDIVGLLHAGDVFTSPTVLEQVAREFDTEPKPDFIFGDVHFSRPGKKSVVRYYSGRDGGVKWMLRGFTPPHPSLYMRRELMEEVGPYRAGYKLSADFEMFLRLFNNDKFRWRYVPLDMVTMATGGLSSRWSNRLWGHNMERMRAFRDNNMRPSALKISIHYIKVIQSYLWRYRK